MIEKEQLAKLALLARVTLSDEEEGAFRSDIEAILGYIKEIENVRIKNTDSVVDAVHNVFRDDGEAHESGIFTTELLDAAPQREGDYIKVKRILGN